MIVNVTPRWLGARTEDSRLWYLTHDQQVPYFWHMPKSRNPVTIAQAADLLSLDRKTVLRWITSGRLPAIKLAGRTGAYLIDPDDLDRLVAERVAS